MVLSYHTIYPEILIFYHTLSDCLIKKKMKIEILRYHLIFFVQCSDPNPNLTLSLTSFLAFKTMMLVLIVRVLDWQRSVPILYLKHGHYCCPLSLSGSWPVACTLG